MMSMMRSKQTGNRGMRGVIALMVIILCSSIPSAFAEVLQNTRYSYDAIGNIEALTDPLNGIQQFAYDDLDRLQTANGPYGNYTYEYDGIGNLKVNPQVSPTPYTYPASGPSAVRPHAVSTAGANTYSYDANGNMQTGAGRTYTWNQENKPLTISQGSTTTTFVYDGDGGRVKKIVGTMTTRYISKLYECDTNGATTSCSRFIWAGDQRIATVADNGVTHYWHVDHLGSSSVITDGTGARVETITYYPYGEVRTDIPGTPVNVPYKYTGQERDSSTGLMYYEARYYDPTLGRFISADTMVPSLLDPQALNRYTYAMNNPMYYTDPSGHCPWCIIGIGIGIGILSSGLQSGWDLKATLLGGVIGGVSAAVGYTTFGAVSGSLLELGFSKLTAGIAGGIVGGGVAGGTSGVLANLAGYRVNIGLAIVSGAAAGGIVGGAGAQFGALGAFAAAPAAGAAGAAISGSDPGMGAAIAAATAAFAVGVQQAYQQYVQYTSAGAQNVPAQEPTPDYVRVGNIQSEVVRKSIAISSDGVLTFKVQTRGLSAGSSLSTRLQTGFLDMNLSGNNAVNFRPWGASIPGTVGADGIAKFGVSVFGVTGPAYMRIIPDYLSTLPPVITNFGPGAGKYIPCNPCNSQLNYDQAY